jgi:hypothetical protein
MESVVPPYWEAIELALTFRKTITSDWLTDGSGIISESLMKCINSKFTSSLSSGIFCKRDCEEQILFVYF